MEIKKSEDIIESNKDYIKEINVKKNKCNSIDQLDQFENRLKQIFQTENLENKKII